MSKNIGKILKECRIDSKISVKEISEILTKKGFKASESTIYSWENDNSQPTPGALLTMCTAYGIDDVLSTFGYNGYKEDGSISLSIREIEMIEKYRTIEKYSPRGKESVDYILDREYGLAKEISEKKSVKDNVVEFNKSDKDYLSSNAAHPRTDIEIPEGADTSDNDIMDNPKF